MHSANRFINVSKVFNNFTSPKIQRIKWIIGSAEVGCRYCHLHCLRQKTLLRQKRTFSFQPVMMSSSETVPKDSQAWHLSDNACPQGIQGDIHDDDVRFKLWLENCRRYGLGNCDQQLEGIQSGRKTIAEVIAEQEQLIVTIAEDYRKLNAEKRRMSLQGVQDTQPLLPDIAMPCPQGVQGEDCARFKLWLENCHQFKFGDCTENLYNYTEGRKSLADLFAEQEMAIKEAASASYQKRYHNVAGTSTDNTETVGKDEPANQLSSGQKLKNAVKVYGSTVIVFHVSISLVSLGFFYTLVSSGIDVVGLLGRLGVGESILQNRLATGTGTFVVAYAVHKIFAPARIAATLTATPLIVRYLRRIGFLKKPPSK